LVNDSSFVLLTTRSDLNLSSKQATIIIGGIEIKVDYNLK